MDKKVYIEDLAAKLTSREIDRRRFMQGALATGMTVTAATALADKAEAATPKKGGRLVMGVGHGSTTDSKDPSLFENDFTIGLTHGYNGYLTQIAADGSLQPSVAESWESSPDAKTWTFKLRQGVEFHNGKTVTADDVVASINHHRGEGATSAAAPLVASVTDIKADGDNVVVTLDAGNADFPFIVHDYHIPVMQANSDGTMDWESEIGCGAYKIDHYDTGVSVEVSKHGNHWDDSVGHLEQAQMLVLHDPNARTSALVSGDCDGIDLKTAGLLGRKPGVNLHKVDGTQHYTFPMRGDLAPWNDNNIRMALKYACDRQEKWSTRFCSAMAQSETIIRSALVSVSSTPIWSKRRSIPIRQSFI